MSEPVTVPIWLLHLAGWGGGAAVLTVLWPGIKWLFGFVKKKLEGSEASTQVNINLGPGAGGQAPTPREMEALVEHAIEVALTTRLPAAGAAGAVTPQDLRAVADRIPTDFVTRRELQTVVDRIPTDVVTRRDLQALADRIPNDPVTRREHEELRQRQTQAEGQQTRFREKVLQRLARMMERLKITLEQEERDDDGNGG